MSLNKLGGRIGREDTITYEDALKRFNDFYNDPSRNKTDIGRLRAKMFDAMYQKKEKTKAGNKRSFKCNTGENYNEELDLEPGQCEKGSAKYNLEMGPKTFDIEGIDSFPEGTSIDLNHRGKEISVISKGSSNYKKMYDSHIDNEDLKQNEDGTVTSNKIYGPRIKHSGKLYNEHFKNKYNELIDEDHFGTYDGQKPKNIVQIYWDKYNSGWRDDEGNTLQRKNKKKKNILSTEFVEDDDDSDDDDNDNEELGLDEEEENIDLYEFQDMNGTLYKIDNKGVVYDEYNTKLYNNITDTEVNK